MNYYMGDFGNTLDIKEGEVELDLDKEAQKAEDTLLFCGMTAMAALIGGVDYLATH